MKCKKLCVMSCLLIGIVIQGCDSDGNRQSAEGAIPGNSPTIDDITITEDLFVTTTFEMDEDTDPVEIDSIELVQI